MKELKVPSNVKHLIEDFVNGLRDIYGDGIISAILYGSAASGEYIEKRSNINIAIILKDTSLSSLSRAARLLNKSKFSPINPVFFTEDYIKQSADVFPVEFLDMKENNNLLYGRDLLKDIHIDIKNLRFQCEQELKSKILNIKKIYLRTRSATGLKNLLFKSLTSSLHILRNLVRLKGKSPAYVKDDIVNDVAREFGIDTAALKNILDAKNKNIKIGYQEIDNLFGGLVGALENISDKVDAL